MYGLAMLTVAHFSSSKKDGTGTGIKPQGAYLLRTLRI